MKQPFYRAFEDRYRGSREAIRQRLLAYLPFLTPLAVQPRANALDLGCGRGEWLELLGEQGFTARGVDLDDGMLGACRERGLDVENNDAIAALRALPDGGLALVSAFHLVEHIPFDLVRELVTQALRVLQPGGLLIMETPNPENLVVGATDFYTDPSHLRPIPPNLLAFLAEYEGFDRSKIVRLQEDPRLHGNTRIVLAAVLQGASPDYSVVAQKAGPPNVLARLDAAFGMEFGIDTQQLALRFEHQREQDHAEIHRALERLDQRIAEDRASASMEINTRIAATTAQLADQLAAIQRDQADFANQLHEARRRADQSAQQVIALLDSTSWRITAPLRSMGSIARRLKSAYRDGRLSSGLRHRARSAARSAALEVLRRPRMKRAARKLLAYFPALQRRLYGLVHASRSFSARVGLPPEPVAGTADDLSPRAARIYAALQAARHTQSSSQQ